MTNQEKIEQYDLLCRIIKVTDGGDLFWRVDDDKISVAVNCNDLFFWACADCEEITLENIEVLEKAYQDVKAFNKETYVDMLFACRVAKMRPQPPYYKHIPEVLHKLINDCGPERNPKDCG